MHFCCLLIFLYSQTFQRIISRIPSECHTVWSRSGLNPVWPDLHRNCLRWFSTDTTSRKRVKGICLFVLRPFKIEDRFSCWALVSWCMSSYPCHITLGSVYMYIVSAVQFLYNTMFGVHTNWPCYKWTVL